MGSRRVERGVFVAYLLLDEERFVAKHRQGYGVFLDEMC